MSTETTPIAPSQPASVSLPRWLTLGVVLVVLGFNIGLYGLLGLNRLPTAGLAVFNLTVIIALLLNLSAPKRTLPVWIIAGVGLLGGTALLWRANGFVQSCNILTMGTSWLVLSLWGIYEEIHWLGLWLGKVVLGLVPKLLGQFFTLLKLPKETNTTPSKVKIFPLIKTVGITLIIVLFFSWILSSADPIFAQLIQKFQGESVGRIISSLFVATLAAVILTLKARQPREQAWKLTGMAFQDLFVPAIALIGLFGVFLIVQAHYLFGAATQLQSFGITLSEYVRKGFIELLVATFFGGLLVYVLILKLRELENKTQGIQLKLTVSVLLVELGCLLLSALKRDLLYIESYGLTRVRIIGGGFLGWLTALLVVLLLFNWVRRFSERTLWAGLGVITLAMVVLFNVMNIDQVIVAGAPRHHTYRDFFYVNNLSEDGYRGWAESVPLLASQIELLTQKTELTDIEKSQLADAKLSLIALQEKRDNLMKKVASDAWIIEHYCQQMDCSATPQNPRSVPKSDYNEETGELVPTPTPSVATASVVPLSLQKSRGWQFYNASEQEAAAYILNNTDVFFSQVDELVTKVREYQQTSHLNLYKQERWFIRDFSYPFISVHLGYNPEELRTFTTPRDLNQPFDKDQERFIKQNGKTVKALSSTACTIDPTQPLKLAVMVQPLLLAPKTFTPVTSNRMSQDQLYQIWDTSVVEPRETIHALVFANSKVAREWEGNCQNSDFCPNRGTDSQFGWATLTCSGSEYVLTDWSEISSLVQTW